MEWTSLMSHPVALWVAGLLILTCTLFACARHKYLRKKRTLLSVLDQEDAKWQQRAVLSSELLEKFQQRADEVLAEHRRLDAQLASKQKNLQGLIDDANKTMERLKGLIDTFEKAYYGDESQGQVSISGVFKTLQNDFMSQLTDFASSLGKASDGEPRNNGQDDKSSLPAEKNDITDDELFGSFDSVLDELGLSDLPSARDDLDTNLYASGDASDAPNPAGVTDAKNIGTADQTDEIQSPIAKPGSAAARSRQVRKLHGQGKTVEEIAAELSMNAADVEVLVRVLGSDRRVA